MMYITTHVHVKDDPMGPFYSFGLHRQEVGVLEIRRVVTCQLALTGLSCDCVDLDSMISLMD